MQPALVPEELPGQGRGAGAGGNDHLLPGEHLREVIHWQLKIYCDLSEK